MQCHLATYHQCLSSYISSPQSMLLHAQKYTTSIAMPRSPATYTARQSQRLCDCPRQAHADANSMSGRFQKHFCKGYDLQAFAETNSFSSEINDGLVG